MFYSLKQTYKKKICLIRNPNDLQRAPEVGAKSEVKQQGFWLYISHRLESYIGLPNQVEANLADDALVLNVRSLFIGPSGV